MEDIPISDLKVLFLTRCGDGYVGAPQTRYGFEQEVANLCSCRFAGEGWDLHRGEETMNETVERVMPDADWVIDYDNHLHVKKPMRRRYKVGHFISDLHAKHIYGVTTPVKYVKLLNEAGYDAVFMRYKKIYGTDNNPDIIHDSLLCDKHGVPWSVNLDKFTPKYKKNDVAFIGTLGNCYPLRQSIWEGIRNTSMGYNFIRETSPKGKTYERLVSNIPKNYLVGERYSDALARTKIMLFGCSIYRYPLQKFFESQAAHCLVMSDEPGSAEELGFIDGKTYVKIDKDNWKEKLRYYLENPRECYKITRRGVKNTYRNHNHKVRAKQFIEILENTL